MVGALWAILKCLIVLKMRNSNNPHKDKHGQMTSEYRYWLSQLKVTHSSLLLMNKVDVWGCGNQ